MFDASNADYSGPPPPAEPESCGILPHARHDGVAPNIAEQPDAAKRRRIAPEAQRRGAIRGSRVAAERRREAARDWDEVLYPCIVELRASGMSLARIAFQLTVDEIETRQGRTRWHAAQVARILRRTVEDAEEILADLQGQIDDLRKVAAMARRARTL